MEASEKPQLPLDAGAEGTVRALEDRVVIERLTVTDERAAQLVRDRQEAGQEPAQAIADAIEIGARVLDREDTAAEIDYVRAELERAQAGFERRGAELGERLAKGIESGNEGLAERIAETFGPDRSDSVQQQIREIVAKANEEQRAALARQFSAEDGANPLADFKGALVRAVTSLAEAQQVERAEDRQRIEAMTAELAALRERFGAQEELEAEQARGTAKGIDFEDRAHEAIVHIAAARGDAASRTGTERAEGGGKKGDTLVELRGAEGPSEGRVVFEAKDKKLSRNDAWKELNGAMATRAASFAVLVVADDRVPSGRETLTEYEGNKLIVAVDRNQPAGIALETAYRLAAARVTAIARAGEVEVDAAAIRDEVEHAISTLKHAQAIRSTLTGIKTSSDKARGQVDELVDAVRSRLERIESLASGSVG